MRENKNRGRKMLYLLRSSKRHNNTAFYKYRTTLVKDGVKLTSSSYTQFRFPIFI